MSGTVSLLYASSYYIQPTHELGIFVTPLKYIYIKGVHIIVKINQMILKGS